MFKINKDYSSLITTKKNFPKPGIEFYDTSQIFLQPYAYNKLIEDFIEILKQYQVDAIAAVEARGWPLAASIANLLELPIIFIYKEGKLPSPTHKEMAVAEYNSRGYEICLHQNFKKVVIIDDVMATGGTIFCAKKLLEQANCNVIASIVLLKIKKIAKNCKEMPIPIHALITK